MTTATETIERTPAAQRQDAAAQHVQQLTTELERVQTRKQTAAADATRLHDEIAKAERAGTDPTVLAELRRAHTETEGIGADLDQVLSVIEAERITAQAELRAATVGLHAQRYNELAAKQRGLTDLITEAIDTITESLAVKVALSKQQDDISTGEVNCPNTELSPASMRQALVTALIVRLQVEHRTQAPQSLHRIDWSCRQMADGGNLE
jgi:hypothetical protein